MRHLRLEDVNLDLQTSPQTEGFGGCPVQNFHSHLKMSGSRKRGVEFKGGSHRD